MPPHTTNVHKDKHWWEEIRDEVDMRNRKCRTQGLNYVYTLRHDGDPYQYKNLDEFKKAHKFNVKKDCAMRAPKRTLDANSRYYKHVHDKPTCNAIGGIWDASAINRKNKYDTGTCWRTVEDGKCGRYAVPRLLRPKENLLDVEIRELAKRGQAECNSQPECQWTKMRKTYDCFSKVAVPEVKEKRGVVMDPPVDMPADVTADSSKIETYLQNWYVNNKPSWAPMTTELKGEGNRCVFKKGDPLVGTNNKSVVPALTQKLSVEELEQLDPLVQPDASYLIEAMGPADYGAYVKHRKTNPKFVYDFSTIKRLYPDWEEEAVVDEKEQEREFEESGLYPSVPQSIVNMVMKNIARSGSTNRGLMAWHSTGSGKTCTATGVMESFWDTDRQIVFASSLDAIASNPDYKFHECAVNLYPRFQKEPYKGKMDAVGKAFEERGIVYVSFAVLSNRVKKTELLRKKLTGVGLVTVKKTAAPRARKAKIVDDEDEGTKPTKQAKSKKTTATKKTQKGGGIGDLVSLVMKRWKLHNAAKVKAAINEVKMSKVEDFVDLDNTVLIIDEVHNLFRPLATQREQHRLLEGHLVDPKAHPNLKLVILTATPGDNVPDIMKLLNMVRDPTHDEIVPPNVESADDMLKFKSSVRGLVSFFDMSSDLTKFPKVVEQDHVRRPMSMKQFEKYLEAYKGVKDSMKNYDLLAKKNQLNKYWQGPRKYANMLYTFEKGMALTEFSSKLPALLDNFTKYDNEKHYAYSAFYEKRGSGQGIMEIARQLEKMGYEKLEFKEARKYNTSGVLPQPKKRYVLAIQSEIGEEGSKTAGKNLHELIKIYNSPENKNGELIHVFLASQGFNEGIDLKAVRHIHIFEPLVTMASDLQTIGRARRYCSHADLDRDAGEWVVNIHRYFADMPVKADAASVAAADAAADQNAKEARRVQIEIELEGVKGKRDKASKEIRDRLKEELKELGPKPRKSAAAASGRGRKKKLDAEGVISIDDFIHEEARIKMKEIFTIYLAIKQSAIDCRVLASFHKMDPTNDFACAF